MEFKKKKLCWLYIKFFPKCPYLLKNKKLYPSCVFRCILKFLNLTKLISLNLYLFDVKIIPLFYLL